MDLTFDRHEHTGSRKRSRSPRDPHRTEDVQRHRSRSPNRHSQHRHHHSKPSTKARLPLHAHHLHKRDFDTHRAVFAEYLDIQKQLDVDELSEDEVKGRWKSFLGKWNRGELAEGWYDPETKAKADARQVSRPSIEPARRVRPLKEAAAEATSEDDANEDGYGPALPDTARRRIGPTVPGMQDLQHKRELAEEDREGRIADIRHERKLDRTSQKERLEELAPRAEPGSRERQIEKKRENAVANRSFADAKEGGGVEEVGDKDLMGEDGVDSIKAEIKAQGRRKNEREIRKEEVLRARAEERGERLAEYRRKEDKTVEMLKELAKARFG
ncbi:hypothetical protein LTR85_011915 [Meristemomyces frigidus]|nr:hypothetical protein LTR85_011915 [Meristemomyces frigidus]